MTQSRKQVSAAPNPKVSIVVLTWNNYDATSSCLDALRKIDYSPYEVVLVDNGSSDGSYERLKEAYPEACSLQNRENLGFSRGCNVGIRHAMADAACKYILLVNNDCTVGPVSIGRAVAVAEADHKIGVVTGKIVDEKGRIWHAGGTISLLRGQSRTRGFREPDAGQFEEACDTEWASGAMMLIRREVIERLGPLPEQYFFGVEEWDYSLSVQRGGYRIRYVPEFAGMHPGGGSHDNHDPKFAYNYYRNKLLFQERHLGRLLFKVWLVAFRAYLAIKMRRHIAYLASITYAEPKAERVDEVVFAAQSALRDHGKNALSEATMLQFDAALQEWRAQRETKRV